MPLKLSGPAHLELAYMRAESRLAGRLANIHWLWQLAAAAAVGALVYLVRLEIDSADGDFAASGAYVTLRIIRWGILLALPFSLAVLHLPKSARPLLLFASLSAMWILTTDHMFGDLGPGTRAAVWAFVPALCLGGYVALSAVSRRPGLRWRCLACISALYIFMAAPVVWQLWSRPEVLSALVATRTHLVFIMLAVLLFKPGLKSSDAQFAFNPFHGLRGAFWPVDNEWEPSAAKVKLWWHGLLNVALGFSIGLARMETQGLFDEGGSPIERACGLYLMIILSQVAAYNILTGCARLFGYPVRDATYFVWLSRTPAEFWRRGSVYAYDFIMRYVYLPVLRRLKGQVALSTFIAFLVFFLNHHGVWHVTKLLYFNLGWGPALSIQELFALKFQILVFLFWFALIHVSRKRWFFTFKGPHDATAWLSIGLTHAMIFAAIVLAAGIAGRLT